MPTPAPAPAPASPPTDLASEFRLLRQGIEFQHGALVEGQRRIETSVTSLREEVAKTYVDKVVHTALEGRVKATEDGIKSVDGKVGTLNGYMGWLVKTVIGLIATAAAALLFSKGGLHP